MSSTVASPPSDQADLADLALRYPKTVEAFSAMPDGDRALQAVVALEKKWIALNSGAERPQPFAYVATPASLPPYSPDNSFDVIIAGGSLGLIAGVALARRGLRVMLFDRDRVGAAHREWNISERELSSLQRWGIFTQRRARLHNSHPLQARPDSLPR